MAEVIYGERIINTGVAHKARVELDAAGLKVRYLERGGLRQIDPAALSPAIGWLAAGA